MPTVKLDRVALAGKLRISPSALDRLVGAKLLRPAGHDGRKALYTLADGRQALKRAAAQQTPYSRSLVALLAAQADEARAREAELRAQHIHASEWEPQWREFVAAVKEHLARWVREAPPRIVALMARASVPRLTGYAVQAEELRPLLTSLAEIRVNGAAAPASPDTPTPSATPPTIPAAKQALVAARAAVSRLRADLKNASHRWRRRAALEWERRDVIVRARAVLWASLPGRLVGLAGGKPTETAVQRELAQAAAEAVRTLGELGRRHGGSDRDPGEAEPRQRPQRRRARRTR